jgi:hypothetical protein
MLTSLSRIGSVTPKPLKNNEIRFFWLRESVDAPVADVNTQLQRRSGLGGSSERHGARD